MGDWETAETKPYDISTLLELTEEENRLKREQVKPGDIVYIRNEPVTVVRTYPSGVSTHVDGFLRLTFWQDVRLSQ